MNNQFGTDLLLRYPIKVEKSETMETKGILLLLWEAIA